MENNSRSCKIADLLNKIRKRTRARATRKEIKEHDVVEKGKSAVEKDGRVKSKAVNSCLCTACSGIERKTVIKNVC